MSDSFVVRVALCVMPWFSKSTESGDVLLGDDAPLDDDAPLGDTLLGDALLAGDVLLELKSIFWL